MAAARGGGGGAADGASGGQPASGRRAERAAGGADGAGGGGGRWAVGGGERTAVVFVHLCASHTKARPAMCGFHHARGFSSPAGTHRGRDCDRARNRCIQGPGGSGIAPKDMVQASEMQRFVSMIADAAHAAGRKVTVGSASLKWSSHAQEAQASYWDDASLRKSLPGSPEWDSRLLQCALLRLDVPPPPVRHPLWCMYPPPPIRHPPRSCAYRHERKRAHIHSTLGL